MPQLNQRRGSLHLIAVACVIIGALFALFSLPLFLDQVRILHSWPEAQAQVLGNSIVTSPSANHGQLYSAQLQLSYPADSRWITSNFSTGQSSNYVETARLAGEFPVGSLHPIRYDPKHPEQARIDVAWTWRFFVLPLVTLGCGLLFLLVAAGLSRVARWAQGS